MQEVCKKCGLPEDLCVCEAISKETQEISVYTERARFGKLMTVIEGIDEKNINLKDILKKLKTRLACGGTIKDGVIKLQGSHQNKVKELLIKHGFNEEAIKTR